MHSDICGVLRGDAAYWRGIFWAQWRAPGCLALLDKGYLAVSLFFILSGFILVYTYQGKISGTDSVVRFWEARFARIYPVYLLALALMIPFARTLTLGQRFTVLAMVQTWMPWRPDMVGAWNFPAWSLSVEAFFYLTFPLIFVSLNRLRAVGLRWLTGILLTLTVIGDLSRPVEGWPQSAITFFHYIPLPILRLPEFVVGMAFRVSVFAGPDMATQWIGFCLRVSCRHYRPVPAIGCVGLGRSHPFCSSNYEPCLSERAGRSVAVEQDCRIARRRQLRRVPAATADTNLYPTFICSDPARAA